MCLTPQRTALATVLSATIVLAAACGGGSGGQQTSNTTPTVANTSRSTTTTAPIVLQVDKDVWYAGFQFHLATATIDPVGAVARQMVIEMTAENQGPEAATPDLSDVALVTPDGSVAPDTSNPWKTIPAGGKANAEVVFFVEDDYVPGKDTVIFGTSAVQQAKVPLGTGDAVSLEPRVVAELGTLTAGTLTLVLTAATVRADIPDRRTQQDANRWTLIIDFTATYSGTAPGGYFLVPSALTAKAPNGTSAVAEPTAVRNASYALKSGVTETGTWRFTVEEPPTGAYQLTLTASEGDPEPTSSITLLAT